MAKVTVSGNVYIDMRDLADDSGGVATDGYFYDDVHETFNGITYEDVIEVAYSTPDGYGYAYFGGQGIGESGGSLTGTITGFLDEYYDDAYGYQGFYTIEGISIRMSDLEKAVSSDNDADYIALVMNELAGNDSFTLGQYADYVNAGAGADRVKGYGGNDTVLGGTGNDTIDGGSGSDSMIGGPGNDLYVVNTASDRVVETSTSLTEIDSVQASISYTLGSNIERLTLTGTGNLSATGNGLSNSLTGNSGNNIINGGLGNDTMIGGAAGDTYYVNSARDVVVEASGGGTDIVLSNASYTLSSFVERLTLTGTPATNGTGNSSSNVIIGNNAANTIYGAGGNDTLTGRGGDDILMGGAGNDMLTGGSGLDSFRFSSALGTSTNVDRLVDFNAAYDRIELSGAVFTGVGAVGQLSAGAFRAGTTAQDATDRVIYDETAGKLLFDADGSGAGSAVLFANVAAGTDMTAADIFIV